MRSRRLPAAALSLCRGAVGRLLKPVLSARRSECRMRLSEPVWQTTRVFPRSFAFSAEASERALGTAPPAAGLTDVSGRGSGQYDVRSTWAAAAAGIPNPITHEITATRPL